MFEQIKKETEKKMQHAQEAYVKSLSKIRAGRPSPALLDGIMVNVYGSNMPVNQVGNVAVEDNRVLVISVWDKANVPEVERAILASDLGLNPSTSGMVVRLSMPILTEETRLDYVKQAKAEAEHARVSVRNIRRDANQKAKNEEKNGDFNEDDVRRLESIIQELTDKSVKAVDALFVAKESELKHF